jgi:hypothetical protein
MGEFACYGRLTGKFFNFGPKNRAFADTSVAAILIFRAKSAPCQLEIHVPVIAQNRLFQARNRVRFRP